VAKNSAQFRAAAARAGGTDRLSADSIDRAYLARFTLGNAALEQEVLELFAAQVPIYLQRLREAPTAKAWKEAAHTIKGSAAAIGAWHLARFAEMAEKLDVEAEAALGESHRGEVVAAVASAAEDVCRYIARLFGKTAHAG
jgi:HPt (histidine-containing phosphotransfer) domain-containing protein